jgi:carbonic anhydrase
MTSPIIRTSSCVCCGDLLRGAFSRRSFVQGVAAFGASAMLPSFTIAAEGNYEAMVLGCIDPRLQEPMHRYTVHRHLTGKFSQFIIAGAAVGVVADAFKDWHKAFWDNLATSIELHKIKKVIAIDHRDCGAAKIAYGADKISDPKLETDTHRTAIGAFKRQVTERHPELKVEGGLMALNGRIEMFA